MFNWGSRSKTKAATGLAGEEAALAHLQRAGLQLLERNYRVAGGPSRRAGEVDLIMTSPDGTLVFVEVRARSDTSHGGAAASVTPAKQGRLVYAAQCYLQRHASPPPCRFDVIAIEGGRLEWLQGAFEA